ncbi:MAG: hypothetical protein ACRCS3_07965 [Paracoccaceae bacterium]
MITLTLATRIAATLTAHDPVYAPILARLKNEALLAEAGGMVIAPRRAG